jgi:hypothetical protein
MELLWTAIDARILKVSSLNYRIPKIMVLVMPDGEEAALST